MHKFYILLTVLLLVLAVMFFVKSNLKDQNIGEFVNTIPQTQKEPLNPLTISAMREKVYPGSDFKIEQTLNDG